MTLRHPVQESLKSALEDMNYVTPKAEMKSSADNTGTSIKDAGKLLTKENTLKQKLMILARLTPQDAYTSRRIHISVQLANKVNTGCSSFCVKV